jgi:hypothetical protein
MKWQVSMLRVLTAIVTFIIAMSPGTYDVEPLTPWKGWAAFVVNGNMTLGMGWGTTAEEAEEIALAKCRKKSLACAEEAAITNRIADRAAHVCCYSPGRACVVGFAPSKEEAVVNAESFAERQGWGRCVLKGVYSARTGLPLSSFD